MGDPCRGGVVTDPTPDGKCDRCPATLYLGDGTLVEVTTRFRKAGWTNPTPFTDRCPACSREENT